MKNAYVILSPARAGDFGTCLLLGETLGEYLLGELEIKDLPQTFLKDFQNLLDEDENVKDFLIQQVNPENIEQAYYSLVNLVYKKDSAWIIEFDDIADFANYVRENDLFVQYIDNF